MAVHVRACAGTVRARCGVRASVSGPGNHALSSGSSSRGAGTATVCTATRARAPAASQITHTASGTFAALLLTSPCESLTRGNGAPSLLFSHPRKY